MVSCGETTGQADVTSVDHHLLGCRRVGGAACSTSQVNLLEDNRPILRARCRHLPHNQGRQQRVVRSRQKRVALKAYAKASVAALRKHFLVRRHVRAIDGRNVG